MIMGRLVLTLGEFTLTNFDFADLDKVGIGRISGEEEGWIVWLSPFGRGPDF